MEQEPSEAGQRAAGSRHQTLLLPAARGDGEHLNIARAYHAPPCSGAEQQRYVNAFPIIPLASINIPLKSKRLLTFVNRLLKMIIAS